MQNTSKNVEIFQLENEAIELKIFDGQESRKIFIKRNGGLDFFDSNEKKVSGHDTDWLKEQIYLNKFFFQIDKLFEDNVLKFFQIPGLNDEIMILDEGKRIWYGELGTELLRKKTNFEPNVRFLKKTVILLIFLLFFPDNFTNNMSKNIISSRKRHY